MVQRVIPLLAVLVIGTAPSAQQQQTPPPLARGTSSLRGTLFDEQTKKPIPGCRVRAGADGRFSTVTTDPDGVYSFSNIAEGNYFLKMDCPSHVFVCIVPENSGGVIPLSCAGSIMVFKDQQRGGVDFLLAPSAAIRGRVVDSGGKAVRKGTVRAGLQFAGNRLFGDVESPLSEEDGSFEIRQLAGGSWRLEVELPAATDSLRATHVYYPGTLKREDSTFIEVATGQTTDVVLPIPPVLDRTLTVRIPPPDGSMTDVNLSLVRVEPLMTRRLDVDVDGQVVVSGLVDGRYAIVLTAMSGGQRWVDFQAIDFLNDSFELSLQPQPAGRIRGRIVTESGSLSLDDASVGAAWIDNDVPLNPLSPEEANVAADGTFVIEGVFGRRKLELVKFDPDWKILSVRQGKSDVTAAGIDVSPNTTTEITVVVGRR